MSDAEWESVVVEARLAIWDDGRGMIGRRNRDQLENRVARAILKARRDERTKATPQFVPHCQNPLGCNCGGDVPAVRETCFHWAGKAG